MTTESALPMRHIEINETKKRHPFAYKLLTVLP